MKKLFPILFVFIFCVEISFAQTQNNSNDNIIRQILNAHKDLFGNIVDSLGKYKVQIIYTQINRDKNNFPHFEEHTFNLNPKEYFYPASTVKLAASVLSLEKLNKLHIKGLNKFTSLKIDSGYPGEIKVTKDSTAENGLPSIAQFIRKIFLVSDNDSFNALYEFLGQQYFNQQLWKKRYCHVKFLHRLSVFASPDANRHTNPFIFYNGDKIIYKQPEQYNPYKYKINVDDLLQGKGFIRNDSLINQPMDFTHSNYFALDEQQAILRAIIFPQAVPPEKRFDLTQSDYDFLYKYMSMFPRESKYPNYSNYSEYPDNYVKYFIFATTKDSIPSNIRIFNKVGEAYGYLIDNAYIVDFKNKVEFFLSAMIYVNEDQIFNDDKYQYDEIGYPFLANLGKVIYNYELHRKRKFPPDLSKFKIDYKNTPY
jgi:Beta-lactamase enzyme family